MTREQEIYIRGLIALYETSAEVYDKRYKKALAENSEWGAADENAREQMCWEIIKDLKKFLEMENNND